MAVHSRFSASGSHRWMRCPGSVKLSTQVPPRPAGPWAEEGTLLHEVAAQLLLAQPGAWDELAKLDEEQQEVVKTYYDYVLDRRKELDAKLFLVEERVAFKTNPEFFGTADAVLFSGDGLWIEIIDLKCGRGVPVEVRYNDKVNPQLGYYMLAVLETHFGLDCIADNWPFGLRITVVQPRAGGVKSTSLSYGELGDLRNQLMAAANSACMDDPPFHAGDHCKFCPAAPICPTLKQAALEAARMEFDDPPPPARLGSEELAAALDKASVMKKWIHAVEERALKEIQEGFPVPGWTVQDKRPFARWKDEKIVEETLRDLGVTDYYKKQELVSPTQAKRLVTKAGWDFDAHMGELVSKKSSGVRLVRERAPDGPPEEDFAD